MNAAVLAYLPRGEILKRMQKKRLEKLPFERKAVESLFVSLSVVQFRFVCGITGCLKGFLHRHIMLLVIPTANGIFAPTG